VTTQQFMDQDGRPLGFITATADGLKVDCDAFAALRFLLAFYDRDEDEMLAVLQEYPALPILGGMASVIVAFGNMLAKLDGIPMRQRLDGLALLIDTPSADEYREKRRAAA
jgi:hypothetical protein